MGELGLSTTGGSGTAGTTLAPGERNTIQALQQSLNDYEFAWHIGDIAYADYWLKEELGGYIPNTGISNGYDVYNQILNAFYDEIANISSAKPYMVLPGNHDANCDNGGTQGYTVDICIMSQRNFTTYLNYWDMPGQASGGVSNMWYSFDYGPVHFVSFNTETDAKAGLLAPDNPAPGDPGEDAGNFGYPNEQIDWLQKDLASVDRCKTPWIIAGGHRPWYVNAPSDLNEVGQLSFEDLLYQYGVDLVLHGHVHNYQRNMPLYKNVTDPNGLNNPKAPWYIVNGIAGHYDGIDEIDASTATPYMAYGQDTTYGYGNLIFHNSTHLTYQFIASSNGSVIDQATLYKEHCPR
jgi:3',5'-cyclic AMP phosphodiesterase CpdA